jgi:OFA family oxalate/formate antiporter-like MFS transporter
LTFALTLDRTLNGITRPFFGWISDKIGRENTMFFAFLLEALAISCLVILGHNPVLFVICSASVFFAWGEIFTLFPALCTDLFGSRYATTNYGLLYTAKGVAAILIPLGNLLAASSGTWTTVFVIAAVLNVLAAGLALFILKPMRLQLSSRQPDVTAITAI